MQKLILVDQFDKEYKRLQRPAAAVAKTDHSLRLSNTLRNSSLADDRKVREYVGELHRYLNVDNRAPTEESPVKINWLTDPESITPRQQVPVRRQHEPTTQPIRKTKKGKILPQRLQWDQYGPRR